MQALINYGRKVGITAITTGDFKPLEGLITDAIDGDDRQQEAARPALYAAIHVLAQTLEAAKVAGLRFAVEPIDCHQLAYAETSGGGKYANAVNRIINDVVALRRDVPSMSVEWPSEVPAALPEPAVTPPPEPARTEPLEVRIVAMPARKTTAIVERDQNENIISTLHVETDTP